MELIKWIQNWFAAKETVEIVKDNINDKSWNDYDRITQNDGQFFAISDTLSSQIIKKNVQRIRPCNDPLISNMVELKVKCGGGYSYTSSHATNHFALAFFLIYTLGVQFRWIKWVLIFWASSIAYGQVYVGVHYPFDVISGAIIGGIIGILVATWYRSFRKMKLNWK